MILAGVRSVTIADKAEVTLRDMAAHFYLGKGDVGKNRAEASKDALQELNTGVAVTAYTGDITNDFVSQFKVVLQGGGDVESRGDDITMCLTPCVCRWWWFQTCLWQRRCALTTFATKTTLHSSVQTPEGCLAWCFAILDPTLSCLMWMVCWRACRWCVLLWARM